MLKRSSSSLTHILPPFPVLKAGVLWLFWRFSFIFWRRQFHFLICKSKWILPDFSLRAPWSHLTFCHFWGQKNCIKKPLLPSQNVNLMLSNEYLRILIDVQINNYAVAPRCSCYQPLHCCRNSIWASVSLLLLIFSTRNLEMLLKAVWLLGEWPQQWGTHQYWATCGTWGVIHCTLCWNYLEV